MVRDSLIRDYGVDSKRVHVVGAGANVVPDREPQHADDGRTLLFVGTAGWRRKGGPVLLKAFGLLHQSRPDLRLVLAGPTENFELPEGVTNLGRVPFEEVKRLLSAATIFVLPTLREPFGIAFLDAMLSKVPCVGTQVGAVPEILGPAGVCVPPANVEALAQAIAGLLDDPPRRAAMAEAGRRRVIERGYLWPEVGQRISTILSSAGNRQRAA